FRHDDSRRGSVRSNDVWCVYEDSQRRLWVGTGIGLDRFDPKSGMFVHYPGDLPSDEGVSDHKINSIKEDDEGNLWIGTENDGLIILNPGNGVVYHYRHDDVNPASISANSLWTI